MNSFVYKGFFGTHNVDKNTPMPDLVSFFPPIVSIIRMKLRIDYVKKNSYRDIFLSDSLIKEMVIKINRNQKIKEKAKRRKKGFYNSLIFARKYLGVKGCKRHI